jgi:C4-dicarboxylate transporter
MAPGALAFLPASSTQQRATKEIMQSLHATKPSTATTAITAATASVMLGIGLSTQAAFANDAAVLELESQYYSSTSILSSSTVVLAEIEKFTLPSYDASKGSVLIDISSDLQTVNKKT